MRFKITKDDLIRLVLSYLRLNTSPEKVILTNHHTNPIFKNEPMHIEVNGSSNFLNLKKWKKDNLRRVSIYLCIDLDKFQELINYMVETGSIHLHKGIYDLIHESHHAP